MRDRIPIRGLDRLGDWTALVVIALMWGTAFAFIRLAVESVSPAGVAAGRIVVAAAVLCVTVRLVGFRFPPWGRIWLHFLALAIIGNVLPFYLISWGQQTVPSGVAGILMGTNPLVTLVLAHFLVRGEPMTLLRAAGFAVGFVGVLVLMGPEALAAIGGDLLRQGGILAGALCYATNTILTRRMPQTHPLVASACVLLVASPVIVPAAILAPGPATEATAASLIVSRAAPSSRRLHYRSALRCAWISATWMRVSKRSCAKWITKLRWNGYSIICTASWLRCWHRETRRRISSISPAAWRSPPWCVLSSRRGSP